MDSNPHFFLGLAATSVLRMSFLMLANSFRVGTCFNSFFLPLSICLLRAHLKLESDVFAVGRCDVPLAVSKNPARLVSKVLQAARTVLRNFRLLILAIEQYFRPAFAANTQNSHFRSIENSLLFAHGVLL